MIHRVPLIARPSRTFVERITASPGGGGGPPGAGEPFYSTDFSASTLSGNNANGFAWTGSNGTVGYNISNPGRNTTPTALKLRFPAGSSGTDAWAEQRFNMGRNLTEVWLDYYWWISGDDPPDFPEGQLPHLQYPYEHRPDPPSSNNKWFWLYDDQGYPGGETGQVWYSINAHSTGEPDRDSNLVFYWSGSGGVGENHISAAVQPGIKAFAGQWVRIRHHAKLATGPGTNDGVFEGWWNDTKLWDLTGLNWYSTTSHYFRDGYFGGYHNSGYDQQMVLLLDDVDFYDTDPGW